MQPENGICIKDWRGGEPSGERSTTSLTKDRVLDELADLLLSVV